MLAETLGASGKFEAGLNSLDEAPTSTGGRQRSPAEGALLRANSPITMKAAAKAAFLKALEVARRQRAKSWSRGQRPVLGICSKNTAGAEAIDASRRVGRRGIGTEQVRRIYNEWQRKKLSH